MSVNRNIKFLLPTALALVTVLTVSCRRDPKSPGVEYMPDMYRTPAIKAYVNHDFPDSLMARKPVQGTIPYSADPVKRYDNMPYAYENTLEGYEAAGAQLKNPVPLTDATLEQGKKIYANYCSVCHGEQGKGDGKLVQLDRFPPPPAYNTALRDLPEGKMFHTITYGKGLMGSHASQLTKTERWKVIHYVQQLQKQE
jgi:mono/diheme cytochrome c family protein